MMRKSGVSIVAFIFLATAWSLQPLQTQCMAADAGPEYISAEQLKDLLDAQTDMILVDTRSKSSYNSGHIPGAISMLYPSEITANNHELPKDKLIIFY